MEDLVAFLQTTKNGNGIFHSRLIDKHRLEPTFQSGILFDILPIFIQRRCTDTVQLTTSQHRLQKIAGIHAAFGFTGTDDGMQFINKQDNTAFGVLDLVQDSLQSFLEFTPVLGSCNQCAHIQREDGAVLQTLGNVFLYDSLGKAFSNGCLADTGLTD